MAAPAREPQDTDTPRAARDGCDCPPWIIRCAHFDGYMAQLNDISLVTARHLGQTPTRYAVVVMTERPSHPCPCCGTPLYGFGPQKPNSWTNREPKNLRLASDDYNEALAAFHKAEEALLRAHA